MAAELVLSHLPVPWLVPVLGLAAVAAGWWSWRRYGPAPGGRLTAGIARGCRAMAVVLMVLALGGPALRTTWRDDGPGRVLVALDTSASMAQENRQALIAPLAQALATRPADQAHITWMAIGGPGGAIDPARLPVPTADGSALGEDLLALVAAQRPDRMIVVSDGRVTQGTSLAEAGRHLRQVGVPVHTLAVGSDTVVPELAIDAVEVNRAPAAGEREPVTVRLAHRGLPPGPVTVTVQVAGQPAQETVLTPVPGDDAGLLATAQAELEVVVPASGSHQMTVTARAGTLTSRQAVTLQARERALSVLLLESRPRYEMRYLREALRRDRTITLHAYLADGRWRRWGGTGPERLPLAAKDLQVYDAIIIGDLGPEAFRAGDLAALDAAVRRGGAGLVLIPGESGATAALASSPAGALIPAELPDAGTLAAGYLAGQSRRFRPTAAATALGVLTHDGKAWPDLPALLGAGPVTSLKPGAEVLAEDQDRQPLIITRSYGAGRTVLLLADDLWRWRLGTGDTWLHRAHSQILRFAAAGHKTGATDTRLTATPARVAAGEPLTIELVPARPEAPLPERAVARLHRPDAPDLLIPLVPEAGALRARLPAPAAGTWSLSVASGADAPATDLLVTPPTTERRDLRADPAALAALASGGHAARSVEDVLAHLPQDLRRTTLRERTESLWDGWTMLLLMTLLLGIDWSLRRHHRMP